MLNKISHNSFIRQIYYGFPAIKSLINKLYRIQKGNSGLMANRAFWQVHSTIKYFRWDCSLFNRNHIKDLLLPIVNDDIVYIHPNRIKYAIMPATQQWSNTEPLEKGNWDLSNGRYRQQSEVKQAYTDRRPKYYPNVKR